MDLKFQNNIFQSNIFLFSMQTNPHQLVDHQLQNRKKWLGKRVNYVIYSTTKKSNVSNLTDILIPEEDWFFKQLSHNLGHLFLMLSAIQSLFSISLHHSCLFLHSLWSGNVGINKKRRETLKSFIVYQLIYFLSAVQHTLTEQFLQFCHFTCFCSWRQCCWSCVRVVCYVRRRFGWFCRCC